MKGHLFDADGVIFDSERAHAASYIAYARRSGVDLSEDRFMTQMRGKSGVPIMRSLFPHESTERILERVDEQNALFRAEFIKEVTLIRGVEAYLHALLESDHRVIVVSNGTRENLRVMLEAFSLDLDSLTIEDFGVPKPDPTGYLKALETLGITPREGVVYEDSEIGVQAAKRAGIAVVGIASFLSEAVLRRAGADAVISDFTEIQIP